MSYLRTPRASIPLPSTPLTTLQMALLNRAAVLDAAIEAYNEQRMYAPSAWHLSRARGASADFLYFCEGLPEEEKLMAEPAKQRAERFLQNNPR